MEFSSISRYRSAVSWKITPLIVASLLLFAPSYLYLAGNVWTEEQYSHGAVIPLIFLWLLWRNRELIEAAPTRPDLVYGPLCLLVALVMLVVGRRGALPFFETLAQVPYILGLALTLKGRLAASYLRFPLFFLLFMVPLPGIVMYAMTAALKEWNAYMAVEFLYHLGYPVARDGVVIVIDNYRLFLADACAGINSIYALSAIGLLFIYLARDRSTRRKIVMALMVLPLAVLTNLIRVTLILLTTYYFNDVLADRLHELIGYVVFVTTLALLFLIEKKLLEWKE